MPRGLTEFYARCIPKTPARSVITRRMGPDEYRAVGQLRDVINSIKRSK